MDPCFVFDKKIYLESVRICRFAAPMDLSNFEKMDPHLLLGVINTELRNRCEDLEDLCHVHDLDRSALESHLAKADYSYQSELNQFR